MGRIEKMKRLIIEESNKRILNENTKLKDVAVGQVVIKNSEYDESTNELSFKFFNDVKYFEKDGELGFSSTPNVIEPSSENILGIYINKLPATRLLVTLKVTEIDGADYGAGSKEMKRFKINDESDITLSLDKEGSPEEILTPGRMEVFEKYMGKIKDNIWFNLSDDL